MTKPTQEREKTWAERLDEFLVDEFHFGLDRVITETIWSSDVRLGAWTDPLQFFECLNSQHEYLIANHTRQQWSTIHWKKNENGVGWSEDMRTIRVYFQEMGLTKVVASIDNDLDN